MIKSMTGYGRAQKNSDLFNITAEVKSVNHRYFEFSSRVPRSYAFLDEKLKSLANSYISRGKVEFSLQIENVASSDTEVSVNKPLAQSYIKAFGELSEIAGKNISGELLLSSLINCRDIFEYTKLEFDEDSVWNEVLPVASEALEKFVKMREAEGEKLKNDVLSRAKFILEKVEKVEERSPQTVKEYNDKLLSRISEFLSGIQVDEQRIATECAIFADKVAVAEETVRLRSHIDQLNQFLNSDEPIGRKTDFLVQEMNREANTIGSKAQDVEIARCVLDIKSEIEKIREQIQNIE